MAVINNSINANSVTPLPALDGGSGVSNPTAHGILVAEGAGAFNPLVLTNGQLLIGSTGADPVPASLTAGANITITPGAGSITIASAASLIPWVDQTTTPVTMAPETGYVSDTGATMTVFNIPATVTFGTVFSIAGKSAGLFQVVAAAGQVINFGNTATSSGGSITSTNTFDQLDILCVTANTTFVVRNAIGNLNVA